MAMCYYNNAHPWLVPDDGCQTCAPTALSREQADVLAYSRFYECDKTSLDHSQKAGKI
jgi:hypothetical protein